MKDHVGMQFPKYNPYITLTDYYPYIFPIAYIQQAPPYLIVQLPVHVFV